MHVRPVEMPRVREMKDFVNEVDKYFDDLLYLHGEKKATEMLRADPVVARKADRDRYVYCINLLARVKEKMVREVSRR